jgi:hypothetical protein
MRSNRTTEHKGKSKTPALEPKTNPAISFYAEAKANERVRAGKNLVSETSRQLPSSSPAPRRSDTMQEEEEENFDDFDFGEEEDILREMEQAEQRQRKLQQQEEEETSAAANSNIDNNHNAATSSSVQASTSATPSLTASSTSHAADLDLDDGFGDDIEEDDEFLKSIAEAEVASSSQRQNGASSPVKAVLSEDTAAKTVSPVKASSPLKTPAAAAVGEPRVVIAGEEEAPPLFEEEEEDLYS